MTLENKRIAREKQTVEQILVELPAKKRWAETVFSRLKSVTNLPSDARVLDVGAGTGGFLIACTQLGFRCDGLEPWDAARQTAKELSERMQTPINILAGSAEAIPFEPNIFDVVHASSVIEHVEHLDAAIAEIHRVLKPGGIFWFNAASSMCPAQAEISSFPLFGWYPNSLKLAIMNWAKDHKPQLVGYTQKPAVNWFTPGKARRLLGEHGFQRVFDRWDLRGEGEGNARYRFALRLIRNAPFAKTVADVIVPGCSFAAIK